MKELWTTQLKKNETIRNYCDRYCKLMRDCRIEDDHEGIVSKFINSLPVTFQDKILMVKVANPLQALTTVIAIANLVIALDVNLQLTLSTSMNRPVNNIQLTSTKSTEDFFYAYHKQNLTHNSADCKVLQQ